MESRALADFLVAEDFVVLAMKLYQTWRQERYNGARKQKTGTSTLDDMLTIWHPSDLNFQNWNGLG
jgi:hypothetical protein